MKSRVEASQRPGSQVGESANYGKLLQATTVIFTDKQRENLLE